jgi:hypothetical protein
MFGGSIARETMKHSILLSALLAPVLPADTSLTIYNRDLAVVRESLPIKLEAGENRLSFAGATAKVQPASVVLRDPAGDAAFSILEQGYRNDPVSRSLLLQHFEGETIAFRSVYPDGEVEEIEGKIVRSGHVPGGQPQDPIIEVEGKLRFQLPGEPLFPALGDDTILRPTLSWVIGAPEAAEFDAQLSYLSQGFSWQADYNFVAPETGNTASVTGWVTLENRSGTAFQDAAVKLVAGDVNIVEPEARQPRLAEEAMMMRSADAAAVEEKAFGDFHLYTLPRPLTIRDKETKQVEFLRAPEVRTSKKYVYDGAKMFRNHGGRNTNPIGDREYPKDVAVFWEFTNDEASGLGMPLPAGRVRFYRSDEADGNLEFVGENEIDHTPRNEEVSLYTGNAFDLVGERKVTNFTADERRKRMSESVEVTVKNRSKEAKTIIVREHLWRWSNWEILEPSAEFTKIDADTIEFEVALDPDEEKTVTYTAQYTW